MESPLCNEEYLNDNSKLEAKVLRALSRLQRKNKSSGKLTAGQSTSVKQIVRHLKNTYALLDGDIETQVMTALMQCVKNGLVCALENNKYLFLGPKAKRMANYCISRTVHGECCKCAEKYASTCCILRVNADDGPPTAKKPRKKKKASKCSAESVPDCCDSDIVGTIVCDYCFEIHPVPYKKQKRKVTPKRSNCEGTCDKLPTGDEDATCNGHEDDNCNGCNGYNGDDGDDDDDDDNNSQCSFAVKKCK